MKKVLSFVSGLVLLLAMSSPAKAVIIIDDWTLNLSGIDGLGAEVVQPIGQITYFGLSHVAVNDANASGGWDVGETARVDGLLNATSFQDTYGSTIFGTGLGSDYQLTFDFSTLVYNYYVDPVTGATSFAHLAGGFLNIYVDGPAGGVTPATASTGAGYQDGVLIATFAPVAGSGGIFTPATFDGSDDAMFQLVSALPGVILGSDGTDLTTLLGGNALFAITDSNFDADPRDTTPDGFDIAQPSAWPFADNIAGQQTNFYAEEDGSARLGVVPEPSTFLLLGAGLLGLGAFARKRK